MTLLTEAFIFITSTIVLAKASHMIIKFSVRLARVTRLGELVTGFLVLSLLTALPELVIALTAAISGNVGISIGSVLGSNITSICLIVGLVGILHPIKITEETLKKLTLMLFLSGLISAILLISAPLSKSIGIILLFLYVIFVIYSVKRKITLGKLGPKNSHIPELKFTSNLFKPILFLIFGLVILNISAWFAVNSASKIAVFMGITQSFIGATIIAIGASLPELFVVLDALKEGHISLGLGDTMGECMTNLTLVLGIVMLFAQFTTDNVLKTLIIFHFISSMMLWIFLGSFGKRKLERSEGIILIIFYILFLILISFVSFPGL